MAPLGAVSHKFKFLIIIIIIIIILIIGLFWKRLLDLLHCRSSLSFYIKKTVQKIKVMRAVYWFKLWIHLQEGLENMHYYITSSWCSSEQKKLAFADNLKHKFTKYKNGITSLYFSTSAVLTSRDFYK